MHVHHITLSSLTPAQLAAILQHSGYTGRTDDLVGIEATFLRMQDGIGGHSTFSYRTKFYDTNQECWSYGGVCVTLQPDGTVSADYTGSAVPIRAVGATKPRAPPPPPPPHEG